MQVWQIQELSVTVAKLYLSGLPEKGELRYPGEKTPQQNASSYYSLSTPESESGLIEQGVTCH
ncbi:hypothetical protein ACLB1T_11885 [Escherichia coli]